MGKQKEISKAESFVSRKIADSQLDAQEFTRRLKAIKQLLDVFRRDAAAAGMSFVKIAAAYRLLYQEVERDGERVRRLNKTLGLDDTTASKWRRIALAVPQLKQIRKSLPPAPESLYQVTVALRKAPHLVEKAVKDKRLTPESTLREIRALLQPTRDVQTDRATTDFGRSLKTLECHITLLQEHVLRPAEFQALQQQINVAVSAFNIGRLIWGVTDGRTWRDSEELEQLLVSYWERKDADRQAIDAEVIDPEESQTIEAGASASMETDGGTD